VIGGVCVNCTAITNNNGPNHNNTRCRCLRPDQWQWDLAHSVGYCNCNNTYEINTPTANGANCLNCRNLSYTTGGTDNNMCVCTENFIWNATGLTCYCPTDKGWTFDSTGSGSCTCPSVSSVVIGGICVNCTAIPSNNGPNATQDNCNCINPYQWTWLSPAGSCLCNLVSEITTG
jgi:hypothetical protein